MAEFSIRPRSDGDQDWIAGLLSEHWGSTEIVTRGAVHKADSLPAFIAEFKGDRSGLVTYRIDGDECEIVSLNSLRKSSGVGTALLDAVIRASRKAGCRRLWLITTNDNLAAVRFYQKRGFCLAAVHRDAISESRRLKPTIPRIGIDGIPIRDEIELETRL